MNKSLVDRIHELQKFEKAPSGTDYAALSLGAVERIASEMGIHKREVEIGALENGVIPLRYHRHIGSLGIEGQLKLRRARVAIIGAGGLGGTLIELFARLGIGGMVVIDGESFTEDNLNRQLLATEENIGKSKVQVAAERVARVNSAVEVETHQVFIYENAVESYIKGCDVIVDALDNIPVRLLLQDAARRLSCPVVHGALAGFVGELMTIFPQDQGLHAIFGAGKGVPEKGIEVEIGTPTITPAIIASFQAMEVVKLIVGSEKPVRNRLLYFELEENKLSEIDLSGP
jgi:molybdopterin/thiamine biosynthesis adenylyltransferase